MVEQIIHTNASFRNRNNTGITFGNPVPRKRTLTETIGSAYGVDIPKRTIAEESEERLEAFMELEKKYPHQLNIMKMVARTPIDEWEKKLNDYNEQAAAARLVHANSALIKQMFRRDLRGNHNDAEQFEWILEHINTDDVLEKFTTAANTLGETVTDPEAALAHDPDAALALRTEGAKLKALGQMRAMLNREDPHRALQFAALFTKVDELPKLSVYKIRNRFQSVHTPDEEEQHTAVKENVEFSVTNPDAYLTLLAMGRIPNLTFSIAESVDEWEDRVEELANLGTTEIVAPPKHNRPQHTIA